jgi:phosphoserine phosphatase
MPQLATHALVLIGGAGQATVTASLLQKAAQAVAAEFTDVRWLAPGEAVEIQIALTPNLDSATLLTQLKSALNAPIDINLVPLVKRRKHLLIADMDSTMIQQECIDEMAALFGLKDKISAITERAMRGELPFEAALIERLSLLKGLDEAALERVYTECITLMPGGRTLVATMKAHGAYTALVSGGFTFFTARVATSTAPTCWNSLRHV